MVAVVVVLRAVAIMVVIMAVEVVAMAQLRLLVDPRPYAAYGSRGTLAATDKYQTFSRSPPEVDKALIELAAGYLHRVLSGRRLTGNASAFFRRDGQM